MARKSVIVSGPVAASVAPAARFALSLGNVPPETRTALPMQIFPLLPRPQTICLALSNKNDEIFIAAMRSYTSRLSCEFILCFAVVFAVLARQNSRL